jgi:hypothetical protein
MTMKNKNRVLTNRAALMFVMVASVIGFIALLTQLGDKGSGTIYTPVDKLSTPNMLSGAFPAFDESLIFSENNYIFSGVVQSSQEVKIEWIDDNNEPWGPYYYTIYTVIPNKIYYSEYEKEPKSVKMSCYTSSRAQIADSFIIEDGAEYIFIAHIWDETDKTAATERDKLDRTELYKYSDICLRGTRYYVLPVENETVYFNNGFEIPGKEKVTEAMRTAYPSNTSKLEWISFDDEFSALVEKYKGTYGYTSDNRCYLRHIPASRQGRILDISLHNIFPDCPATQAAHGK